jgi:hypothetical protein
MTIRTFFARFGIGKPDPNPLHQPTIRLTADGWIPCEQAQPEFGRTVLIRLRDGSAQSIGLGRRTPVLALVGDEKVQEAWQVLHFNANLGGGITEWKPLPAE